MGTRFRTRVAQHGGALYSAGAWLGHSRSDFGGALEVAGSLRKTASRQTKSGLLARVISFRRCANGAENLAFKARVEKSTAPSQYAAGVTQTAETMYKCALVNLDSRASVGLHKVDVPNAHGEYERQDAANVAHQSVPESFPWLAAELAASTSHCCVGPSGAPLRSLKNRGGDQGGPCTSLECMLTCHSALPKCQQAVRAIDPEADAYGYQGGLDTVAPPEAERPSSQTYVSECAKKTHSSDNEQRRKDARSIRSY